MVSDFTSRPLCSLLATVFRVWMWPQNRSRCLTDEKNVLPLPIFKPRFLRLPNSNPVEIQNGLTRLQSSWHSCLHYTVWYHCGWAKFCLQQRGDFTAASCKQSNINLALCSIINYSLLFSNLITPPCFNPHSRTSRREHTNHRAANCTPRSTEITVNSLV